jgi:hypothetical protein
MPKVKKGKTRSERGKGRHCPPAGTPEFSAWKKRVAAGMRRAIQQRKKAGILNVVQIAAEFDLPLAFTKQAVLHAAEAGELTLIRAGTRFYVRRPDAVRLFGTPEGRAA